MRIVIAPDKFKGSLSSLEVCDALVRGIQPLDNEIILSSFPMADGGDGYFVLRDATDRLGGLEDLQAFEAYIRAAGAAGVSPPALDRVTRIN